MRFWKYSKWNYLVKVKLNDEVIVKTRFYLCTV